MATSKAKDDEKIQISIKTKSHDELSDKKEEQENTELKASKKAVKSRPDKSLKVQENNVLASKTKYKRKNENRKSFIRISPENARNYGTGKRKTSIARVWVLPGSGKVEINKRDGLDYLMSPRLVKVAQKPLSFLNVDDKYDVVARVKGGGISSQASAVNAGVAKALIVIDDNLQKQLKDGGYLTRDARIKERKHYGHKRARKSFQFSKR